MNTLEEELVNIGGVRVWTAKSGSGPPILLCNGGPGCCDYLRPVAEMIDDLLTVHRWEQRGCGRSDLAGPYDQATCIADIDSLRGHFGYEKWIIGGHSWGANLALAYAIEFPDRVAGMIYLSGTGINEGWKPDYRKARDERGETQIEFDYPYNPEVNQEGNRSRYEYLLDPKIPRCVRSLDIPALIVHGSQDIRPSWPAAHVAELMPKAQFVELEGVEHYLWLKGAEPLREHLQAFVREAPFRS